MLESWKPLPGPMRNEMRVTDLIRKSVVFIGHRGVDDSFCPDGTGFFLVLQAYEASFPYIVTAKHVIDQAAGEERLNDILIRVNTTASDVDYIKTKIAKWHMHPDHLEEGKKRKYIDVAAYSVVNYRDWAKSDLHKYDFTFTIEEDVCTDDIIKKYAIGLGDEVVIPGLFLSHIGTQQNIPVVRTGNIAADRGEHIPTSYGPMDAYLVEMRSVGGISGSPVLTQMAVRPESLHPGTDIETTLEKSEKAHFLLGLVHGHYTITAQEEWVFKTNQHVGDINAGIAVVVPYSKIMETILQSSTFGEGQEMARQYSEAVNSRSKTVADSAKPTSSSSSTPSDDDVNPRHLEDFTRLVDVAARKRPRGDQT
jgi:hypothetical protein